MDFPHLSWHQGLRSVATATRVLMSVLGCRLPAGEPGHLVPSEYNSAIRGILGSEHSAANSEAKMNLAFLPSGASNIAIGQSLKESNTKKIKAREITSSM